MVDSSLKCNFHSHQALAWCFVTEAREGNRLKGNHILGSPLRCSVGVKMFHLDARGLPAGASRLFCYSRKKETDLDASASGAGVSAFVAGTRE